MVETPTRSRIEGWTTGHLKSAALGWERQATLTEQLYTQAQHAVDQAPWTGAAADSASAKLFENLVKIRGALEHLRQAEKTATAGADAIDAAKRSAVAAITNAVEQFFAVAEDLTVTDRMPPIFGAPLAVVRMLAAAHFQADIRAKAMLLAQTDERVANELDAIARTLQEFDMEGGKGGVPGAGPSPDPRIVGGPTPLRPDGTQGDLNVTIPGTGIEISGDGRTGYPTLNGRARIRSSSRRHAATANGHDRRPRRQAVRALQRSPVRSPDGKTESRICDRRHHSRRHERSIEEHRDPARYLPGQRRLRPQDQPDDHRWKHRPASRRPDENVVHVRPDRPCKPQRLDADAQTAGRDPRPARRSREPTRRPQGRWLHARRLGQLQPEHPRRSTDERDHGVDSGGTAHRAGDPVVPTRPGAWPGRPLPTVRPSSTPSTTR